MRVLVVEDEAAIRQELVDGLMVAGYAVDSSGDGKEGLYYALEYPLDVAIIDIGLPSLTGVELIERARAQGRSYPMLILTARGRWQDKVAGLEAGADDYLVKPFHMEELLARLRALVRRSKGWTQDDLRAGNIALATRSQRLEVDGVEVELTAFEYKVLEYLMLNAGEVVSKTTLGEHVYGEDLDPDSNVLEVLIGRLRRKLDPGRVTNPIETLRGRGYRFALEAA
jgi:two-component system, OmpR family, response regulator PhoP